MSSLTGSPADPPYTRYAAVYDRIGQRVFGERIAKATIAYLTSHGRTVRSGVDLACGTGAATFPLAAAEIAMTGIDRSAAMLEEAHESAILHEIDISWLQQDMTEFAVQDTVDLVTCFYDGVNYLTEIDQVRRMFRRVAAALEPGGLFVFDVNTRHKFATAWNDICYLASDTDDLFGVYRSWWEPATGRSPLRITFFGRADDGSWDRFDEEHVERAYPLDELADCLASAHFRVLDLVDYVDRSPSFGGPGNEKSQRVVFIAERVG